MRSDREMAVEAMQNMGWTAKRLADRRHPRWVFQRPDTGGLWDRVSVPQANLSMIWVTDIALQYGDAQVLAREIAEAKEIWMQERFMGIFTRKKEPTHDQP